jgi:hypothetical protein
MRTARSIALFILVNISGGISVAQETNDLTSKEISVRAVNNLNLRKHPDPNSAIITIIPIGTTAISGTGRRALFEKNEWMEIIYDGQTGWVNARFLERIALPARELLNFELFKGRWKGNSSFTKFNGDKEKGVCALEVYPEHGPWQGRMELACKASSIEIIGRVYKTKIVQGAAKGFWQLTNYSITGDLDGYVTENSFYAVLRTQLGFAIYTANISATVTGDCSATFRIDIQAPIEIRSADGLFRRC